jgi:hypothetical protein
MTDKKEAYIHKWFEPELCKLAEKINIFFPAELRQESIESLWNVDTDLATRSYFLQKDARARRKMRARNAVHYRIHTGYIKRPKICAGCGRKIAVEAHHPDHEKALEVRWLCRDCHIRDEAR